MRYYINPDNSYVGSISTVNLDGEGNATAEEYNHIMRIFECIPPAPDGFEYKLRADNLHWELAELPECELEDM